jgi:hydrogenase maturation protease
MNRDLADKIARATLYEGYILYPYRPSVKSRQRWTFGGIYPKSWSDAQKGTDPHMMQTEVLVAGTGNISLQVVIRFLHLVDRTVGKFPHPLAALPTDPVGDCRFVQSLQVGDATYQPWQEAIEREVDLGEFELNELVREPRQIRFAFPQDRTIEPVRAGDGKIIGALVRRQQAIEGLIEIGVTQKADDLRKVTLKILNRTDLDVAQNSGRDDALMRTLVSMHVMLGVGGGELISLTDAPDKWQTAAAECKNIGLWPVLIGTGAEYDTMLASPIILYDYPQLAPESPGDLFDSTEIDEILTLRILTLTDEEKRSAASVDPRARDLLARTESLAREQLMNLHGTMRGVAPARQEQGHG